MAADPPPPSVEDREEPLPEARIQAPPRSVTSSSSLRTYVGRNPPRICKNGGSRVTGANKASSEAVGTSSPPKTDKLADQSPTTPEAPAVQSPLQPEPSVLHTPPKAQSPASSEDGPSSEHQAILDDDGSRRCRMRRPLRFCYEALAACGQELDEAAEPSAVNKKRKRNKDKSERCGRGLAKPRAPVRPEDRPELLVVGDAEFTSTPKCTKIITTIRLLTLENLPGPYRSYNMFPTKARLVVLQQFMQRYSWGLSKTSRVVLMSLRT